MVVSQITLVWIMVISFSTFRFGPTQGLKSYKHQSKIGHEFLTFIRFRHTNQFLPRHQHSSGSKIRWKGNYSVGGANPTPKRPLVLENISKPFQADRLAPLKYTKCQNEDDDFSETSSYHGNVGDSFCLPKGHPYLSDILPALSAVRKACRITAHLQPQTKDSFVSGINKADSSPVTIGDFAAQALVLKCLHGTFPEDVFIAEEGSSSLVRDNDEDNDHNSLADEIMQVLHDFGHHELIPHVDSLKQSLDLGQTYNHSNGSFLSNSFEGATARRVWCLDPIDGTRGFLRGKHEGGQYCVALSLIEDGIPTVGILGCPNLPMTCIDDNFEWSKDEIEEKQSVTRGCVIIASKGGGCFQLPLYLNQTLEDNDASTKGATQLFVTPNDGSCRPVNQSRFCIGVEKYSDPLGLITSIGKIIHGSLDQEGDLLYTCRLDSQVKYGILARGEAEAYMRLPKEGYVEWIWDHAAGKIVLEEAGGRQTDAQGLHIKYGLGAKLDRSVEGIIGSCGGIFHKTLLGAYKDVKGL